MAKKKSNKKNKQRQNKAAQPSKKNVVAAEDQVVPGEEISKDETTLETVESSFVDSPSENTDSSSTLSSPEVKTSKVDKDEIKIEVTTIEESPEEHIPTVPEPVRMKKGVKPRLDLKHPLHDTWAVWFNYGMKGRSWDENLVCVHNVSTVEDFWSIADFIRRPSTMNQGRDLSFFKEHIRPEWEDKRNNRGGIWSMTQNAQPNCDMDKAWLEILILLIGNQDDELSPLINGVTYAKRKNQDRISLWIGADWDKQRLLVTGIGQLMKKSISLSTSVHRLEFSTSNDWKRKSCSTAQIRITV